MSTEPQFSIPVEVLDVAAVVTGGESLPLKDWQRTCAIQAMHALGYRIERIQQALEIERRWYLAKLAREIGIDVYANEQPDMLAVEWVRAGTCLRLRGVDRDAAIAALAADGKGTPEIARRIGTTPSEVAKAAERLGVHTLTYREQLRARPVSVAA